MSAEHPMAPDWQVERWFNAPEPLGISTLRGRVVVLEAFQMLCPGCVSHGLPQARILHLLVERVDYNGPKGTVAITFHPTGIKTLADELKRQEATTCKA